MNFPRGTRTKIFEDMTLDVDPTGSTVELAVDGTWYPAAWQGSAVQSGSKWTQTALTTGYFAGPDAVASGATVLTAGRHLTTTRVTLAAGDVLVHDSSPIDVG
jgi:hypothetical protein